MAVCRLCHEVLPVKNRRTIFTPTFGVSSQLTEVLGYTPRDDDGLSKYVCGFCFCKLNKLSKIEFDLKHKVQTLNVEKSSLLKSLRDTYLSSNAAIKSPRRQQFVTSESALRTPKLLDSGKRITYHSPTPRKCKKPLLFTPKKTTERTILPKRTVTEENKSADPQPKRVNVKLFSPSKVKVYPYNIHVFIVNVFKIIFPFN